METEESQHSQIYQDSNERRNQHFTDYINAGFALTPLSGKIPIKESWQKTKPDPLMLPVDIDGNFGVVLTDEDLVIDVDPRHFADGDAPMKRLSMDFTLPTTFLVKTGGDGNHIYFKKPPNTAVMMVHPDYPGLEFKTKGHQVVGAGCIHPTSKKPYTVTHGSPMDILNAPQPLLDFIQKRKIELSTGTDGERDGENTTYRFRSFLENAPVAIQGQNGDDTTFITACKGRDYGLSMETVYELMDDHWNQRCAPPWQADELMLKVQNAFSYARGEQGSLHPDVDFTGLIDDDRLIAEEIAQIKWDLDYTRTDDVTGDAPPRHNSLCNTINYFRVPPHGAYKNSLYKMLRYNQFSNQIEFSHFAPWHQLDYPHPLWVDDDSIQLRYFFEESKHYKVTTATCWEAVVNTARMQSYHPVRTYLRSLKWDGKMRLDKLFIHYTGAEDNEYTRAVGRCLMVGAVARIFNPGCQFDHVVVMEGKQGTGKSSFVGVLGGKHYGDIPIEGHNKDTLDAIRGKWIIELSELECTRRVDAQALKAFISRRQDTFRLPYGRVTQDFPRQCLFIGTINPEADGGYLRDTTGNRRFWPIETHKINLKQLEEDRDQLWAEAMQRFENGEAFHFIDEKLVKHAVQEQEKRNVSDPWESIVSRWLEMSRKNDTLTQTVTSLEVIEDALNVPSHKISRQDLLRVSGILKKLGWEPGKYWDNVVKKSVSGFRWKWHLIDDL